MITGVGTDIVEVARIKGVLSRHPQRFLDRVFTFEEQRYCLSKREPSLHLAARFAAKEATVKALGVGFTQGLTWLDFAVVHDANGKPAIHTSSYAKELFGDPRIHLSISHCHAYATAVAVIERKSTLFAAES